MRQTLKISQQSTVQRLAAFDVLALLVQQVEERRGLLADEVEAAAVVDVVDVVPGDALGPVLLLQRGGITSVNTSELMDVATNQQLRAGAADS